ncbi:MAG: (2Fe-2S)-binding protein [bacterium]
MIELNFILNGKQIRIECEPGIRLVELLREKLDLTGTKEGCGIGECGACTVIMNGKAVNSCLILAAQCEGTTILTVEGLADGDKLHPIQQSFLRKGAVQCGFCSPGMIMSAYALHLEKPSPTEDEIKDAIAGNLCRCTGYKQIIDAIKTALPGQSPASVNDNAIQRNHPKG